MANETDPPKKREPSAEEIQAYLNESAARTKKRLPIATISSPLDNTSQPSNAVLPDNAKSPANVAPAAPRALPLTKTPKS